MTSTLYEIYQDISAMVKEPNSGNYKHIRNYQAEELNPTKIRELLRIDKNLNTAQYYWFHNKIKEGLHPAHIFLNALVLGNISSPNSLKAYENLLTYWNLCKSNDEQDKIVEFKCKSQRWLNSQIKSVTPEERIKDINSHVEAIDSFLLNTSNRYGLLPVVFHAWGHSPEYMVAYIVWLLKKGETSEQIVNSKIFHYYFLAYIGDPNNQEGPVFKLISCMRLMPELADIIEIISQIPAKFTFNDIAVGSAAYHSSYPNRALTGELIPNLGSSASPEVLDTQKPNLILPDFHNAEDYFQLFGLPYLVELILTDKRKCLESIKTVLKELNLVEISELFKQINLKELRNITNRDFIEILGEDKIFKLIEMRELCIYSLMSKKLWEAFFSNKSIEEKNRYIEEATSQRNMEPLLIALYNQIDTSIENKNDIYATVLTSALKVDEDNDMDIFLKTRSGFHNAFVQYKAYGYHEELCELAEKAPSSGLNKEYVDVLQDAWSAQLSSYNRFKRIYPNSYSPFPDNKYEFYIWVIQLEIEIKKEIFDLKAILRLFENEVSTQKRLLTELLLSSREEGIQEQVIKEIEENIKARLFTESSWKDLTIGVRSLKDLAHEYINETLYKRLSNQDIDRKLVDRALDFAIQKNRLVDAERLLAMRGNNKPTKEGINKALYLAAYHGREGIVEKILAITGENAPTQQGVNTALFWAATNGHQAVVEKILAITGENAPTQQGVYDALYSSAKNGHQAVVEKILAITGENAPTQEDVNAALHSSAENGHQAVVEKIIGMKGNKKGVNDALITSVYNGHQSIAEKILAITGENAPTQQGLNTALFWAAKNGHQAVVEKILAITGENAPTQEGVNTALFWAATKGHQYIVEKILAIRGENAPTQQGVNKALYWAASKGHQYIVEKILAITGENAPTQEGVNTALSWATSKGHQYVIEKILAITGDNAPTQKDVNTALYWAEKYGFKTISQLMSNFTKYNQMCDKFEISIKNLSIFIDEHNAVMDIHKRLSEVLTNIKNKNPNGARDYLMNNSSNIEASIRSLQSISNIKTLQNIAATILSCVACLTFIGIPIALMLWKNNLDNRRDSFMFFTKGAKQSAQVAINYVQQIDEFILATS